jgi:hypothetical protein
MVFPVTMATYNYSEAPEFLEDEVLANPTDFGLADSVASFDTGSNHVLHF